MVTTSIHHRSGRDTRTLRRMGAAVLLPLGPLAVTVLRLCLPSFTSADAGETITATAAAPGRGEAVVWLSLVLVLTLIPSVLAAGRLTQRRAPVLTLLAVGLLVPAFAALLFGAGDPLIQALAGGVVPPDAAARVLDAVQTQPAVAAAMAVFVAGHILGMVLLGFAFLRTRVMPVAVAVGVIISQPLHLAAVIAGSRSLDGVAWGLTTLGFAFAALAVLRTSDSDWDVAPTPVSR
jgi:hypothetical protein